jgi:hypothetical protein
MSVPRPANAIPARRIFLPMRLSLSTLAFVFVLAAATGCERGRTGPSSGNTPRTNAAQPSAAAGSQHKARNSGDYSQEQASKPGSAGGGGGNQTHTSPQADEPQTSVSGKPSADSDRGSPRAVGHSSVAEPGAPQGTAPQPKSPPRR